MIISKKSSIMDSPYGTCLKGNLIVFEISHWNYFTYKIILKLAK